MSEKEVQESRSGKGDPLRAVIKNAEAELGRVKEWISRQQTEHGPRGGAITRDGAQGKRAGEPSRGSGLADADLSKQLGAVLNQISGEIDRRAVMAWRQLAITLLVIIIATAGLVFVNYKNTQALVGRLEQSQLTITDPPEGASVGIGQKVRGLTPYSGFNHYIVVTIVRTGSSQVRPASLSADGTFRGDARFTDGSVGSSGEDDEFSIRVLVTKFGMEAGPFTSEPNDAIFSRQVTVRRTKLAEPIVLNDPVDGADVSFEVPITGQTSFPELNHFVVVKSLKDGVSYVQDKPVSVNHADGAFSGKARFGSNQVGAGMQFSVRILATKSALLAAPLTIPPADAVFSNSVTVTRKK